MDCSPGSPLKPRMRFDDELQFGIPYPGGQRFPVLRRKHDSEVRYRHVMPIHRIAVELTGTDLLWFVMRNNLMSEKIKVDPVLRTATFWKP